MKKIFHIVFLLIIFISTISPQSKTEVTLNLKIFLQGSFHNKGMKTILRDSGLIPPKQPYSTLPWEYKGTESADSIYEGVVDWILVELTKEPNENEVYYRKACFLKSDGSVFDADNNKGVVLTVQNNQDYYVIVHHRNHISIVSSVPITINNSSINYDFTKTPNSVFGNSSLVNLGNGNFGMLSGDSDSNGIVSNSDFQEIATHLFQQGYLNSDLDMNGVVNVLDYGNTNINITKKSFLAGKP